MAEAFLRGEVTGRPPSAPATAEAGRHIVPFAEVPPPRPPCVRWLWQLAGRSVPCAAVSRCRCRSQPQMRASSTPRMLPVVSSRCPRRMLMQFTWLLPSMQGQVCCR